MPEYGAITTGLAFNEARRLFDDNFQIRHELMPDNVWLETWPSAAHTYKVFVDDSGEWYPNQIDFQLLFYAALDNDCGWEAREVLNG